MPETPTPAPHAVPEGSPELPWYRELNGYHWWIILICILGWTFDTMDQRLFALARGDAMNELIPEGGDAAKAGRVATAWFIYGWATGGLFFGILGDKWGRARTMMLTILIYALFTAWSGFSKNLFQFNVFRFLTGLGVGGEFAAGVALLSEVIPERPRPHALGLMQGLSAGGNITGSLLAKWIRAWKPGAGSWRYLFYVGAVPALLVVIIRATVREPESWLRAREASKGVAGRKLGSYLDLLRTPRWRKNAIIGMTLGITGVTGLWGIGFYTPELITDALSHKMGTEEIAQARANMTIFQDIGAALSMYGFALVSTRIGRRPTLVLSCLAGMLSVWAVFGGLSDPSQIWWMGLILGFGTLALFGGFAVYFPELFPTRLRSTGVSLCYNVARYAAGFIQSVLPQRIHNSLYKGRFEALKAKRATNMTVALIYVVGMIAVLFAPETNGKPLPTDDDGENAQA